MKITNWVLYRWDDDMIDMKGTELYEVEYAGSEKVIVKLPNGTYRSFHYCEVDFITEEEATLWLLENG